MLLTFFACTRPAGPPLLLVSSEANTRTVLSIDGEPLEGLGPFEAAGDVRINGADLSPIPDGVLRYVELDGAGALVVDDWEFGTDVDPDAVLLDSDDPESELWTYLGAEREEDGLLRLESADVWEDLLLDGRLPVVEVLPVWFDEGGAIVGARARPARGDPGASWRPAGGRAGFVDEAGRGTSDADPAEPGLDLSAFFLGDRAAEQLEWVGLYGNGGECLLLDAGGTWKMCSTGLSERLGAWRVEADTLWLDAEAYPLSRAEHTIDLGDARFAPFHAQELR